MKTILSFLLTLFFLGANAQSALDIAKGIKLATDGQTGITDAELKSLIDRIDRIKKELKSEKDFSIETEIVAKSEFDTVADLKKHNIYQLKVEPEGNYLVVKYIDRDLKIADFITKRQAYKKVVSDGKLETESPEEYKKRIKDAYSQKNSANPFKVYYGYMVNKNEKMATISTSTFKKISFNLVTVPFKMFPKTKSTPSQSNGDIDNIGLYTTMRFINWSNLNAKGDITEKSFGIGIYVAPSVVKLDKTNSAITDDSEVNKPYLTTALALHYKYGKFTLMLIPAGVDTAFSQSARSWNYGGHYWWGFGLGVDTSLFNF